MSPERTLVDKLKVVYKHATRPSEDLLGRRPASPKEIAQAMHPENQSNGKKPRRRHHNKYEQI